MMAWYIYPSAFSLYLSILVTVGNCIGFGIANLEQYRMTVDTETSLRLAISVKDPFL